MFLHHHPQQSTTLPEETSKNIMQEQKEINEESFLPSIIKKNLKPNQEGSVENCYACERCDKTFSKPSSLARHKYEHSGNVKEIGAIMLFKISIFRGKENKFFSY